MDIARSLTGSADEDWILIHFDQDVRAIARIGVYTCRLELHYGKRAEHHRASHLTNFFAAI